MKYRVKATVVYSCHTIIEANSEEEALDLSCDRAMATLPANLGGDAATEFVLTNRDGDIQEGSEEIETLED